MAGANFSDDKLVCLQNVEINCDEYFSHDVLSEQCFGGCCRDDKQT